MPSRIASRLTLCQAYQLERAPKEFGSAYGHSFKEHAHNYLRRHLHNGDERFLCRSVSCGVCARVGCLSLGNWAHFLRCFFEHAYAARRTLCSRSVEATARAGYLLRVDRAASMDLIACLPFFPAKASVRFLLIVLVCSGLIAAIPGPAWHSLVRSLVPLDSLGKVFSKRLAWGIKTLLPAANDQFPGTDLACFSMLPNVPAISARYLRPTPMESHAH